MDDFDVGTIVKVVVYEKLTRHFQGIKRFQIHHVILNEAISAGNGKSLSVISYY